MYFPSSRSAFSLYWARNWFVRVLLVGALPLALPFLAVAQELASAAIVGTVTDSSGGVIPNVTITISNTNTGLSSRFTTNDVGQYVAPNLAIGTYVVRAESPQFKTTEQRGVVLQLGDRRRVDFLMEVGAATTIVTVEARSAPVAVQTDSNEISTVLTGEQVSQLTTNGRSLYELVNLVPGASSAQADFQTPTPMGGDQTISFNGNRVAHALYMIDGGEAADRGGSGAIVMPSIDALSEFRVQTSNYSAEFGLVSGATISTAIKSGTHQFHGSAWWFGRNDALDARGWFRPSPLHVQELRFNLWGFNVGGPIKFKRGATAKTFFFYNMEWRREVLGGGIQRTVPFASTYGGDLTDAVNYNNANGNALFNTHNGALSMPLGVQAPYACQVSPAVQQAFATAGQALSGCTGGSADPTKAQPFVYNGQQNVINPALINSNAAALLKAGIFPAPTSGAAFIGGQNAPTNVREEIVRIDHTFNDHYSIFGHFIDESELLQTDVPARWSGANLPTSSDTFGNPSYQAVVHLAQTLRPNLLNEIAFNYGGNRINIEPLGVYAISGTGFQQNRLFSGPNTIIPTIALNGKTGAQFNQNWSPWSNTADSYQIRDDVSWTKGSHQFKFGGSWLWFKKAQPLQDSPQGNFGFSGTFTGYDFADFLVGLSNSYSEAALKDTRHWNSTSWGLYIQDDWRATRRLTVNLGLRWDGIPHTAEINGQMSNFYPNLWNASGAAAAFAPGSGVGFANANGTQICTAAAAAQGNPLCTGPNPFLASGPNPALNGLLSYDNGLGIAGKNGISKGLVNNHWDTFGPRIGFAYDLTGKGKTILRAGFGTFYERIQGNDMYQAGANNLFGGNPSLSNVSLSDPHIGVNPAGTVISATTLPVTANGLTALDPNHYKIPTSYQYSAGIQQQVAARTVVSVAYVGNQGRYMSYAQEINMPAYSLLPSFFTSTGSNIGNENLYRPYLGYGGIKVNQNEANSSYNSLQVSVRSQIHDLTLQAAYTYAHARDSADNILNGGDGGDLDYVTNPYLGWKYDLGPSQYNRQNIAVFNFLYDVPFWRNSANRFMKTVVGGWQVSGVVTIESGQPLNLQVGGGLQSICGAVSGNCRIRPDLVGPISYPKNATTSQTNPNGTMQWFSPLAFAPNLLPGNNSVATWGNLGFDGLWGPGRDNWNLALFKNFNVTERLRFELRFESFNTFNHPQMNGVDTTLGDKDFGKVNSAYDPRVFQLGAKFIF
jgi:hypothetical protein